MRWINLLLELLYAPRCAACDEPMGRDDPLCPRCTVSLYENATFCSRCAVPREQDATVDCAECRLRPPPFERVTCPFLFGGELAVALRKLKYSDRPDVARSLGSLLQPAFVAACEGIELVVPVPLHPRRLRQRGFNQAQLLLDHAQGHAPVRVDRTLLVRGVDTPPQAGLGRNARFENLVGAFRVPSKGQRRVRGRRVLVVDDVVTTGATMRAAAKQLKKAGAAAVFGFAAARAETS